MYDDGLVGGPSLYVGGYFRRAANRDWMRWSAAGWDPLPTPAGWVGGMTVADFGSGEELLVAGFESTLAFSWDGASVTNIDLGGVLDLRTVGTFDDGTSTSAWFGSGYGGINATFHGQRPNRLILWDGAQAATALEGKGIGTGRFDGQPATLHVHDFGAGPELVAGGKFASAGGARAQLVAAFDGTDWRPLGANLNGWNVLDLESFDDGNGSRLYACGNDVSTSGAGPRACARFNGTSWEDFGGGIDNFGDACELVVFDEGGGERLFIGGDFNSIGSTGIDYFARWDGTTWTQVGGGISGSSSFAGVGAAVIFDDGTGPALYVGGNFEVAGGVNASNLARWDGTSWSEVGGGVDSGINLAGPYVQDMAVLQTADGPLLVVAGYIDSAGGVPVSGIAGWDGTTWTDFGGGVDLGSFTPSVDVAGRVRSGRERRAAVHRGRLRYRRGDAGRRRRSVA